MTGRQKSITTTNYRGRLSEKEVEQMLKDAGINKQGDEKEGSTMAAKLKLMDYICSIKRGLESEEVKQETSKENRKAILQKCEKALNWEATKEDYEEMRKEFKSVYILLTKLANLSSWAKEIAKWTQTSSSGN